MAEPPLAALAPALARWTMGGTAVPVAPEDWRPALGNAAGEAELRLLALAAQALGTLTVAAPAGDIAMRADLPPLAKPPLAAPLRPRARRVLAGLRDPALRRALLVWLDRRGWTLHPGDWLPAPGEDDCPAVYAPWQDWAAPPEPALTAAGDADPPGPAARRAAFFALRRRDPAAAAARLAPRIGAENPERRLLILDRLAEDLSPADRPLLAALADDRAPRVKARAATLLARIDGDNAADDAARELAGYFTVASKGWLRKTPEIAANPLKTPAQRQSRAALLAAVPLGALAAALGLAPAALVNAWPWGADPAADVALAAMVARSAEDAIVIAAGDAMTAQGRINPHILAPLRPRLPAEWRRATAWALLDAPGGSFPGALAITAGAGEIDDAIRTAAGRALLAALATENPPDLTADLTALGLIATRAAAAQALDHLAEAGLIAADPRLDMLRLNAALEPRGTDE